MTWQPNKSPTATNSSVALNAATFTQLVAANPNRLYFMVSNDTAIDCWVNLRAVADGTDETGIWLPAGSQWEMRENAIYTGVICAISASGTPTVKICTY